MMLKSILGNDKQIHEEKQFFLNAPITTGTHSNEIMCIFHGGIFNVKRLNMKNIL
jgi:N-methylhydantoinase B/oxoprolinase/acetone carboxylase alpha subunit